MMQRNPFSTRFIKPGSLSFVFQEEDSLDNILHHFQKPQAQGAIVGPHGSGKSTLLETLDRHWSVLGIDCQRVRLTAQSRRKSIDWAPLSADALLVIDGFEQLGFWQQRWIRLRCWQKKARLLVTCHHDCGLPAVLRTTADWQLALQLASRLLGDDASAYETELRQIWKEEPGNVRDYFFRLYHWCESQGIYQGETDVLAAKRLSV
ncbi:hypothetical protein GC197_09525 [bacterium]|nr:hypothetical protein [bacterium]